MVHNPRAKRNQERRMPYNLAISGFRWPKPSANPNPHSAIRWLCGGNKSPDWKRGVGSKPGREPASGASSFSFLFLMRAGVGELVPNCPLQNADALYVFWKTTKILATHNRPLAMGDYYLRKGQRNPLVKRKPRFVIKVLTLKNLLMRKVRLKRTHVFSVFIFKMINLMTANPKFPDY